MNDDSDSKDERPDAHDLSRRKFLKGVGIAGAGAGVSQGPLRGIAHSERIRGRLPLQRRTHDRSRGFARMER